MLFSEELEKYSWDEITQQIYAKTDADVERALNKKHLQIDDFMALISPAADKYLEKMAFLSRMYTQQRFGKTIQMYVPLYITNSCTNHCVYCGFQHDNPIKRVILKDEEIVNECKAIRRIGPFENLLIVTGENSMIRHILFWNYTEKVKAEHKEDEMLPFLQQSVDTMNGKIDRLIRAEIGKNTAGGYDLVFYAEFEDQEVLKAFRDHPLHVAHRERCKEIVTDRLCGDLEV